MSVYCNCSHDSRRLCLIIIVLGVSGVLERNSYHSFVRFPLFRLFTGKSLNKYGVGKLISCHQHDDDARMCTSAEVNSHGFSTINHVSKWENFIKARFNQINFVL